MLFYASYCSVFFFAILAAKTDLKEKVTTEKSDAIFADVIKNISRVNTVLQELINNYEQLQKIYKSQENINAPEYSSETDVDRYFNINKKSKKDKERSFNHYIPASKTTGSFLQATQMLLSEDEVADESTDIKSDTVNENTLNIERTPKVERLQVLKKQSPAVLKTTTTTQKHEEYSDDTSSSEDSKDLSIASTTAKLTAANVKTKPSTSPKHVASAAAEEAEIVFVDTHKQAQHQKTGRIMSAIALDKPDGNKKTKTRYGVKEIPGSKVKDASYGNRKTPGRLLRDGFYNVSSSTDSRPLLHVEFLHTSDSALVPSTKKLKQLILSSRGADGKRIETKKPINLKNQNPNKTIIVFEAQKKDDIQGEDLDTTSQMTDDDAAITKDLFKTSVLRQAYGDACLKLVVRKCYKACKKVIKTSCRTVKCASELVSYFKRHSQENCDEVFEDTPGLDYRRRATMKGAPNVDMTRAGYLSVACLPEAETGLEVPLDKETSQKPEQNDKKLNLLRDRYEKACQRTSQSKCNNACSSAHNSTCFKYECSKQLKKNFRRNCKTHCKNAYQYKKGKSTSDSSSSGSSGSSSSSSS